MDKYEYTIKSDKIKKLVERKDYETAVKIADTIDWERVRNIKMLSTVSLAYEKVSRFEEAKDLLLMAYECAPVGRRFLYKLTELATKQGQYDEAEDYLKEFAATSPQDPSRLILRYEISKAKGEPTERLITILEAYQKREFEERWSYELANLYYREGKNEQCVKLCDEIVLWFGVGTYVDKAMELKQRIAPLTPDQIEKRENKEKYLRRLEEVQREFEDKYGVPEEPAEEVVETTEATEAADVSEDALAVEAELEARRLEQEMKASLAREIEAATLTAALNEAMLRETAATMETMDAVENDHSQEHERTKVAVVHVPMLEKTKEFVREARVINVVLEEACGAVVTVEDVEARLAEESPKETSMDEVVSVEDAGSVDEAVSAAAQGEDVAAEMPVVESVEKEQEVEKPDADPVEKEGKAEEPVFEPGGKEQEGEEPACEPVAKESKAQEQITKTSPPAASTVRDHYVLVACAQEDQGVRECVSYIRRMRELLGYPVTQVAKIRGAKLATKDMARTLRKLQGRDLVVVGIADLPDDLLTQTIELMAADAIESFIALVGTEAEIAMLQSRVAFFAGCRVLPCDVDAPGISVSATEEPVAAEMTVPATVEEAVVADTAKEPTAAYSDEPKESVEDEQSILAKMVEEALRASVLSAMEEENSQAEASVCEAVAEQTVFPQENTAERNASPKEDMTDTSMPQTFAAQPSVAQSEEVFAAETRPSGARLTPKEFYECAVGYAHMMDAKVDDMGGLAIYAAAEEYQQEREPLTEELAQELVENAIVKAERRTLKSLFSNRYDKEGFLILKEQHFKD